MREFSASTMTISAAAIRARTMPLERHASGTIVESDRLSVGRAIAAKPRNNAGSAGNANLTSPPAPLPSKVDPESMSAMPQNRILNQDKYADIKKAAANRRR